MSENNRKHEIEITAAGLIILDGRIYLDGSVAGADYVRYLEEYEKMKWGDKVYTPKALELVLGVSGLIVDYFEPKKHNESGCRINEVPVGVQIRLNGKRIKKLSESYLTFCYENQEESHEDDGTDPMSKPIRMKSELMMAV